MSEEVSQEVVSEESTESQENVQPEVESTEASAAPETQQELEEAVEEAIDNGASEQEVKNLIKEFNLKVNGKTITKKIDLSDEETLRKELQLAAAGRQAMQESAELKKFYTQEIERLKEDPYSVLEELGLNPDELAELRIRQRIEEMQKSPEQQAREQMERELAEARKKLQEEQERANRAEMERLQEQAQIQLDDEISEALDSHESLPNTSYTVKKIADMMLWAMDNGWSDVTVKDVLPSVEKEMRRDINTLMDQMPDKVLESYLGKKNIERLRKQRIADNKKVDNLSNLKKTAAPKSEPKPAKKIKIDDWMRS